MSLFDRFPHKCRIQRRIRKTDEYGAGKDHPPQIRYENIECWEQQAGASEVQLYDKRGMSVTHKIYFRQDYGLTEQDEIVVTERNGVAVANPDILDVKSRADPDAGAGLGVLYRVLADIKTGSKT